MARGDLTDSEWSLIEAHLPLGERGPVPDLRQHFNAVMWRFRTGTLAGSARRVRALVYGLRPIPGWATVGVFERLMQAVIAEFAARGMDWPTGHTRTPADLNALLPHWYRVGQAASELDVNTYRGPTDCISYLDIRLR